jgi:diaminohydroxyphosphoribosylaminopyrimidine deaminase/5-amino-6-(5-phosphoribosylamino)uracil reductase
VYIAPKLLGDNARGLCQLPGLTQLADAPEFVFSEVRQIGPDLRLRLTAK